MIYSYHWSYRCNIGIPSYWLLLVVIVVFGCYWLFCFWFLSYTLFLHFLYFLYFLYFYLFLYFFIFVLFSLLVYTHTHTRINQHKQTDK